MIKKVLLAVILVVVVALAAAYFVRNMLVAGAVETGCTYALGVETSLGSAGLEVGGGSLALDNLEISNPDGFKAAKFLTIGRAMLDVDAGSILDEEVVVDSFVIEGVRLNLEQIDKSGNYRVLMDNIDQLDMSSSTESTQKFRIGLVVLRDIAVTGSLKVMGQEYEKSYAVENFVVQNIGSDGGATLSEVTGKLVNEIIAKSLTAGKGVLPEGFGRSLSDLKEEGLDKLENKVADEIEDLGKSLTDGLK